MASIRVKQLSCLLWIACFASASGFIDGVLLSGSANAQVLSRTPIRTDPPVAASAFQGPASSPQRLIVKFHDHLRARATETGELVSAGGFDLDPVAGALPGIRLRFSPLIRLSESLLLDLEARAERISGRTQPDLAGMFIVTGLAPHSASFTQIAAGLAGRPEVEFTYLQTLGVPPPFDIPPETPLLVPMQTYLGPDPGMNAEAAWEFGARGAGVRLSDCEYGWNNDHEDLNEIDLHLEPGQTIVPDVFLNGWAEHGTAVVGQIAAMDNAYGCTGIAPEAQIHTYPEWTVEEGYRRVTCIANAIANSSYGDVVLLEMQAMGAGGNYAPAEVDPAVWTVVRTGTDAGVVVVGAAGNGNQNLDGPPYEEYMGWGDSGAIIVGAGSSNTSHNKLSFSTYGSRVNVQGWGQNVFTLGYGHYAAYGEDPNQYYTHAFSGTSSASPFVAAACVSLQGLAEERLGARLSPSDLRQLLIDSGIPQGSGGHIGPFVDLGAAIELLIPPAEISEDPALRDDHALGRDASLPIRWIMGAPNPFVDAIRLTYELRAPGPLSVEVLTVAGRKVRSLSATSAPATGRGQLTWDGRDEAGRRLPAGVYCIRARTAGFSSSRQVHLLR
jgi:hypothetical protein